MAIAENSPLSIDGQLYDMTGLTVYTGGVNLGKITVDPTASLWQRDVEFYQKQDQGTTPRVARIVGENLILETTLADFKADVVNVWAQRHKPSGAAQNYHFGLGSSYLIGHTLKSADLISLMVRDEQNPTDKPALYLPACVVSQIGPMNHSRAGKHQDGMRLVIVAMYDESLGSVGLYGDSTDFPALV